MFRVLVRLLLVAASAMVGDLHAADGVIVIGHPGMRPIDAQTLGKIYMGRLIQIGDIYVTAVNADPGSKVRELFLQTYLKQDDGKYIGYWRVRRSVGQGKPPREFSQAIDVINFVSTTPGGIGYIREEDYRPGLNVLLR